MVDTKDNNQTSVAVVVQDIPTPVIVDLGGRKKKAIKRLKNGHGKLMAKVALAIEEARARLPEADQNNQFIPVVIVYKKKKKKGGGLLSNPLNALSPFNLLR
ncbi:MAG: hypothetical protein QOC99_1336 [Acidobacteriota bacterium]|jgi:hypothetical protein|nr:hypothetical protein [Acidobacteriota bacterium]MDT7778824.1 hypothetical protein [Acidobacteriota bacterium]